MLNLKSLLFLIGIKVYEMNPPKTALIYVYGCLGSLNSLRFKSYNQGFLRAGGTRHKKPTKFGWMGCLSWLESQKALVVWFESQWIKTPYVSVNIDYC